MKVVHINNELEEIKAFSRKLRKKWEQRDRDRASQAYLMDQSTNKNFNHEKAITTGSSNLCDRSAIRTSS